MSSRIPVLFLASCQGQTCKALGRKWNHSMYGVMLYHWWSLIITVWDELVWAYLKLRLCHWHCFCWVIFSFFHKCQQCQHQHWKDMLQNSSRGTNHCYAHAHRAIPTMQFLSIIPKNSQNLLCYSWLFCTLGCFLSSSIFVILQLLITIGGILDSSAPKSSGDILEWWEYLKVIFYSFGMMGVSAMTAVTAGTMYCISCHSLCRALVFRPWLLFYGIGYVDHVADIHSFVLL